MTGGSVQWYLYAYGQYMQAQDRILEIVNFGLYFLMCMSIYVD